MSLIFLFQSLRCASVCLFLLTVLWFFLFFCLLLTFLLLFLLLPPLLSSLLPLLSPLLLLLLSVHRWFLTLLVLLLFILLSPIELLASASLIFVIFSLANWSETKISLSDFLGAAILLCNSYDVWLLFISGAVLFWKSSFPLVSRNFPHVGPQIFLIASSRLWKSLLTSLCVLSIALRRGEARKKRGRF